MLVALFSAGTLAIPEAECLLFAENEHQDSRSARATNHVAAVGLGRRGRRKIRQLVWNR